jgi:hypothetical protein
VPADIEGSTRPRGGPYDAFARRSARLARSDDEGAAMTNVPVPWIAGGWSPGVCSRHGEPAEIRGRTRFVSKAPGWAIPFILLGGIVYVIIVSAVRKTVQAPNWPFCDACKGLRTRRLLIGLGLLLGSLVLFLVGGSLANDDPEAPTGALMLLGGGVAVIAGLIVALLSGRTAIARGVVSQDGAWLQFAGSHPRFDAEVAAAITKAHELQAAAYQQWQAQAAAPPPQYAQPTPYGQPSQYGQPGQ